MELGETPEESAIRELEEETGLKGRIDTLVGVISHNSSYYGSVVIISYRVMHYFGWLKPGHDASEAAFFHLRDLPEIAFETHKRFIQMGYSSN